MKKIWIKLFVILFFIPSISMAVTSIGAGLAVDVGFGVTVQINHTTNLMLGNSGAAGDYLFFHQKLRNLEKNTELSWYAGGGMAYFWSGWVVDGQTVALRVPVGLQLDFNNNWRVFLQGVPYIRLNNFGFDMSGALGVRYYF